MSEFPLVYIQYRTQHHRNLARGRLFLTTDLPRMELSRTSRVSALCPEISALIVRAFVSSIREFASVHLVRERETVAQLFAGENRLIC